MRHAIFLSAALALLGGSAGCERPCTPGTVLIALDFAGPTTAADRLDVMVSVAGSSEMVRSIARVPGSSWGTVEVAFAAGYPRQQTLSLRVVARRNGVVVGDGSITYVSGSSCDNIQIAIRAAAVAADMTAPVVDGSWPDLAAVDLGVPLDLASSVDLARPADLTPPPICSVDHWCWANPLPQGNGMVQTFGFAANDVWAVGEAGTILHFDGNSWSSFGGVTPADLWTVWGLAPNDVWAGGQGVILHFDGKSWQVVINQSPAQDTFVSLWGPAPNDIYIAAGTSNVLGHWDGTSWTLSNLGDTNEAFTGVGGSGAGDIWAVGNQLWHSDGTGFVPAATQPVNSGPPPNYLYAVGPGDAWLVGSRGLILHWSGGQFTAYPNVTKSTLEKVWGRGGNDIWACGTGGTAIHWDGSAWQASYTLPNSSMIWGGSGAANDVWFAGDRGLVHYDGATFKTPTTGFFTELNGIWGSGAHDVWTVGLNGAIYHYDGLSWSLVPSGTTNSLNGVWASSDSDAWAVGSSGTILHWNGSSWQANDSGVTYDFVAIWGSRSNDVWAVGAILDYSIGASTDAPIMHWNGSAWSAGYSFSSTLALPQFSGVYRGKAEGEVIAVGSGQQPSSQSTALFASYPGSGTVWNVSSLSSATEVSAIYSATFDTFAVGNGNIFSDDPNGWTATAAPGEIGLNGIYGFADNDIYAVGGNYGAPSVLHWSGSQWSTQVAGTDLLTKVWGAAPNDVWAIGPGGTILHKTQ
jgi:hypothetical protein